MSSLTNIILVESDLPDVTSDKKSSIEIYKLFYFPLQFKNKLKSSLRDTHAWNWAGATNNNLITYFLPTIFISQTFPTVKKSVKF